MSVSKLLPTGGANDFNVALGGTYTTVTFTKEYSAGGYSIVSAAGDTSLDIYAFNTDGSLAAYTGTKSLTATKGFSKMVILGGQNGDLLSFTFKLTYVSTNETTETTAGPFIVSSTATSFPNTSSTIVLTGGNFATDMTAAFTTASVTSAYTATVTRTSITSATIGRPSILPAAYNPYTLTLTNPGITNPTGSNVNTLTVNAGTAPTFTVSNSILSFTSGSAYDGANLSATDGSDSGSTLTYSIASGTLPTGLSLASNGVITGTASTSQQTVTFRVTDTGNNTTDAAIRFNAKPVWVTSGTLTSGIINTAYTYTLSTTDDTATARTYTLASGSLPTGLTLSTAGVISGTPTVYNATGFTFTVTATDGDGASTTSSTLTLKILQYTYATLTSSQSWTVPAGNTTIDYIVVAGGGAGAAPNSNVGASGGGAGGMIVVSGASATPGASLSAVVGNGGQGSNGQGDAGYGYQGGTSSFNGTSCTGGGGGGAYNSGGGNLNGGSGGGSEGNAPSTAGTGTSGQGNNGGTRSGQYEYGSGGGKGGAGGNNAGGGAGYTWIDGVTYAQGGAGNGNSSQNGINAYANYANTGFGGTGRSGTNGSTQWGASGVVKIRYLA